MEFAGMLESEMPMTSVQRQQNEAWLLQAVERVQAALPGQTIHLKGVAVRDVTRDPKTGRFTMVGEVEVEQDISSCVFVIHFLLPADAEADLIDVDTEAMVSGRVQSVVFRDVLNDFIIEVQ